MCTAIYVGKKISKNGHTFIGRTSDSWIYPESMAAFQSSNTSTNKKNTTIKSSLTDFTYKLPTNKYKYNSVPNIPNEKGCFRQLFTNEYGVVGSATVTAFNGSKMKKVDPFTDNGLCEEVIIDVLAPSCKSARECVELIGKLMQDYGSNSPNIIFVADKKEAWVIELYSGHQWAALKLPEDKMAVYGNSFKIQTEYKNFSDKDFYHSKDLFELPKKHNIAVYKGKYMSLVETYAGKNVVSTYCNIREYFGLKLFAPKHAGNYNKNKRYDLFFDPEFKPSIKDIFNFFRCRYEGTKYCPEENKGVDNVRLIATEVTYSAHVLEINSRQANELCATAWICLSNPETSVFLPYSNLVSDYAKAYKFPKNINKIVQNFYHDVQGKEIRYIENLAALSFKKLSAVSQDNRELYAPGVKEQWNKIENYQIKNYPKILKNTSELYKKNKTKAVDYINDYTINMQNEVLAEAKSMFDELIWYISTNIETFKYKWFSATLKTQPKYPKPFKPVLCFKDKYLN